MKRWRQKANNKEEWPSAVMETKPRFLVDCIAREYTCKQDPNNVHK
jgi:hypothetical protein